MPYHPIKVFEIEITGHLTFQDDSAETVLDGAQKYVKQNIEVLNFAITEHDGFNYVPLAPTP
jgi:hypothetical protein